MALDSQIQHHTRQRELQREAHSSSLTALNNKHDTALQTLQAALEDERLSKERLRDRLLARVAKRVWGNESSLQVSVFEQWRGVHLQKVSGERNQLQHAVVRERVIPKMEMGKMDSRVLLSCHAMPCDVMSCVVMSCHVL